jgi:hypothetical protein
MTFLRLSTDIGPPLAYRHYRKRGMSYADVAGFLGREVAEVREEAKRLGVKSRHLASTVTEAKTQCGFKRVGRGHHH